MPFRSSYWEQTTFLQPADVLIIGAGFTGLQTALAIKRERPMADVLVVERANIPRGASTRNAGFACFGGPTELLADIDAYGAAAVVDTVRQRFAGIQALETNYGKRDIDWHKHGGFEVIDDPNTSTLVLDRLGRLNELLKPVTGTAETWSVVDASTVFPNSSSVAPTDGLLVLSNPFEAQLHPGKLVRLLLADCQAVGVHFLFGTEITKVEQVGTEVMVTLAGGEEFRAGRAVITVNAFAQQLLPDDFPETVRPVRNQILLSRKIPNLKMKGCFHFHEGYVYFRNVGDNRLLIGGARHQAGKTSETDYFGPNGVPEKYLLEKLNQWFPAREWTDEDFPTRWSGIIAQGNGKSPVLRFADSRILVAARLAGMGVALSGALARRAANKIYTS